MPKRAGNTTLAAAALAAVCVLFLLFCRPAAVEAVYPVERAKASFSRKIASRAAGLWNGARAAAENVSLKRRLDALAMDRAEYARVLAENESLRESLGFAGSRPGRWIAAEILSFGGGAAGARKSARASKGSLDGVREDAAVETPDGLVGRVASTTPHTCEIMLITDPSVRVSARIESETPATAVLCGGSDAAIAARHIRAGVEIPPGTAVSTSGLGGVFPAGIRIGSFTSDAPASDAPGLERGGTVAPYVDFESLETVFIRR